MKMVLNLFKGAVVDREINGDISGLIGVTSCFLLGEINVLNLENSYYFHEQTLDNLVLFY